MNDSVRRDKSLSALVKRERLVLGNSPDTLKGRKSMTRRLSPTGEAHGGTTAPFSLAAA
jgi:hypothetical protein